MAQSFHLKERLSLFQMSALSAFTVPNVLMATLQLWKQHESRAESGAEKSNCNFYTDTVIFKNHASA